MLVRPMRPIHTLRFPPVLCLLLLLCALGCNSSQGPKSAPAAAEDSVQQLESLDALRQIKGMALVDFYADWCAPCKVQAPVIAEVAERLQGQATIAKIDVDRQPEIAREFRIEALPTLVIFKDGQEQQRLIGLQQDASKLIQLLKEN